MFSTDMIYAVTKIYIMKSRIFKKDFDSLADNNI